MPVGVTVCVCPASALPVKVGCVKLPAAIVGTPAGHEIVGCVNTPAAIVGVKVEAEPPTFVTFGPAPVVGAVLTEVTDTADIAPSANAPEAFVGTPAGHEIAPSENAPKVLLPAGVPAPTELVVSEAPVNVGAATVPAGVIELLPPVPPTSP